MSWGAVAVAVGTTVVGSINSNKAAKSQKDAVETPTRTTGIEQTLTDTEQSTTESSTANELQQILEQMKQAELSTATTTRGTDESSAALSELIGGGEGGQAQIDAIVSQILREGKTNISNVGSRTGSFGSTTERLLSNDLIIKAAEAGARQGAINDQQRLEAIKTAQSGTETKEGNVATTQEKATDAATSTEGTTQTDTTATEASTGISDVMQNPKDGVSAAGALKDLLQGGIANGPDADGNAVQELYTTPVQNLKESTNLDLEELVAGSNTTTPTLGVSIADLHQGLKPKSTVQGVAPAPGNTTGKATKEGQGQLPTTAKKSEIGTLEVDLDNAFNVM